MLTNLNINDKYKLVQFIYFLLRVYRLSNYIFIGFRILANNYINRVRLYFVKSLPFINFLICHL